MFAFPLLLILSAAWDKSVGPISSSEADRQDSIALGGGGSHSLQNFHLVAPAFFGEEHGVGAFRQVLPVFSGVEFFSSAFGKAGNFFLPEFGDDGFVARLEAN